MVDEISVSEHNCQRMGFSKRVSCINGIILWLHLNFNKALRKVMIRYFTSESVTKGHPDKVCDQIADGILDELLKEDPKARCACEVTCEPGAVHIMGEITSKAKVDYVETARRVIREIGYTKSSYGFTDNAYITCTIHAQSPDISMGVDSSYDEKDSSGAGDQGIMFGYASSETEELMPLPLMLARALTDMLTEKRENGTLPYLGPDGKSQVTVEYDGRTAKRIEAVVVSSQHDADVELGKLREDIEREVIRKALPSAMLDENTKIFINPTGRFVFGGPAADTGVTGRKLIVDTYGGKARHGGGAFSGKDPSKVDRSASYALRNIAKTIVASGCADECELQISYAIGVAKPLSLYIDTFGTGKVEEEKLLETIEETFDLRPDQIINRFHMRNPIYLETARKGHFGKENYPWEKIDEKALRKFKSLLK